VLCCCATLRSAVPCYQFSAISCLSAVLEREVLKCNKLPTVLDASALVSRQGQLNSANLFLDWFGRMAGKGALLVAALALKKADGFTFLHPARTPLRLGSSPATTFVPYGTINSPGLSGSGFIAKCHRSRTRKDSFALAMSLIPIPVDNMCRILVTGIPTSAQYSAYWGRTNRERYRSLSEAFNVSFLGVFGAYFLSFVLGQFPALLAGFVSFFWFLISPELKAYQRNWELRGGRDLVDPWLDDTEDWGDLSEDQRGLYGAFYFGRVVHCAVVEDPTLPPSEEYPLEDFADYTMETDDMERITGLPWKFRLRVSDNDGRELQVHARLSEEYLDILPGMPVAAVVLSTSREFFQLAGMTDISIPDAECWVGDYPYLERSEFEREISAGILWDALQDEAGENYIQNDSDEYTEYGSNGISDVPIDSKEENFYGEETSDYHFEKRRTP